MFLDFFSKQYSAKQSKQYSAETKLRCMRIK